MREFQHGDGVDGFAQRGAVEKGVFVYGRAGLQVGDSVAMGPIDFAVVDDRDADAGNVPVGQPIGQGVMVFRDAGGVVGGDEVLFDACAVLLGRKGAARGAAGDQGTEDQNESAHCRLPHRGNVREE